ncbi:MAG: hypothetical protein ACI85Q_001433 [Salibacteraceae bacterium]|jgi:hypothetical protein
MKRSELKVYHVFFISLLSLFILVTSSCTSDCPGQNADLTIENQWEHSIYVEVYTGGLVTHTSSLNSGERVTFSVSTDEIEVKTREKGFLLFPDRENTTLEVTGCWDYEVLAYTDPNNSDRHYLETNHVPR